MIARVTIAAMALVALGLLCASCGSGDSSDDQTVSAATSKTTRTNDLPGKEPAAPSTGGAAAPRGTTSDSGSGSSKDKGSDRASRPVSPATGDTPERTGKRKSRKRVSRDVYKAGKQTCFIFGVDQIRHEYDLVQSSPEDVARFYANLFEKANPDLVAPYYQGCLRGLKQRAQRDRQAAQR